MHLRNYPVYFVKDGERRPVYYTADARDLRLMGWKPEKAAEPEPQAKQKAPKDAPPALDPFNEPEVTEGDEDGDGETDLEFMTKNQLLKYAEERGIEVRPTLAKHEIIEAIEAENG